MILDKPPETRVKPINCGLKIATELQSLYFRMLE